MIALAVGVVARPAIAAGSDPVVLSFTNTAEACEWTVPDGVTEIEYLVVGGGGGGGATIGGNQGAGGGGGGAVREGRADVTPGARVAILVGAGGAGGICKGTKNGPEDRSTGGNGGTSSLTIGGTTYDALGGGGGNKKDASDGGCGGGTCSGTAGRALPASDGQVYGNVGGKGGLSYFFVDGTKKGPQYPGGGGGGAALDATGAGGGATSVGVEEQNTILKAGRGGDGRMSSITGESIAYGGGGGGGASNSSGLGVGGEGGLGGGGAGGTQIPAAGTDGLGGGGGGGGNSTWGVNGARGGSGIVIIRYAVPDEEPEDPGTDEPEVDPFDGDPIEEADARTYTVVVKGTGSFRLEVDGAASSVEFQISKPDRGETKNGVQHDEHTYIAYSTRVALQKAGRTDELPAYTPYSNCVVFVSCPAAGVGFSSFCRYLLPYFHNNNGCYPHEEVEAKMPLWREIFPLMDEREYGFRFVPDAEGGRTLVYLDGSLWGAIDDALNITGVVGPSSSKAKSITVVSSGAATEGLAPSIEKLPALDHRAHGLLASGASLSVGTGHRVICGIPMDVWAPERSIDQGRHYQTTTYRNLTWNPLMTRTPWSVGTEYLQWRVQGKAWRYAWVLCADIPEEGKSACVGTQFAKFGDGCSAGNVDFARTYLDDTGAVKRVVGELRYRRDGETLTSPLYLVRQPLDVSVLGNRGQGQLALDFEFVGCGTSPSYPRSSVQVFGCTLETAPFAFAVANEVRGNIFETDMPRRAAGFDLTPVDAGRSGRWTWEIHDPYFRTLKTGGADFSLGAAGEARHFELDLSEWPVGWYGLVYVLRDDRGNLVVEHESSFTVLHADDREAGYESPYACWPQLDGYHASNPNRREQLEVMRKAGYRKSWHPPCESEAEGAAYKVTMSSVGLGHYNPGSPTATPEELDARLDAAVADYRAKFEAFPHCEVIQLLHEHGGKEISQEVAGTLAPARGEYAGWRDSWTGGIDWDVYFCTEYCKRMRREFPGKRIMVGNGSSSCEMIAKLVRNGFDLSLADQLGIESKGFSSLPELNANLESPGMLWALRETARAFGYSNLTVNACNEYVFRPERKLARTASVRTVMRVTDYTLRDYLISLAHGCDIISTGHLEDCNDAYYETNWGAAGQCTFYPFSYPKRVYTALAVLTRALDCPKYVRRLPTGEITSYALEFRRERKVRDYAYALWTPRYGATLAIRFPSGTSATLVDTFGAETALAPDADGEVSVEIGSSPRYVIASQAALGARVTAHAAPEVPSGANFAAELRTDGFTFSSKPGGNYANAYGIPTPRAGAFTARDVADDGLPGHNAVELVLQRKGTLPDVIWENAQLDLKTPIPFKLSETGRLGIYVRGNGSFAKVQLLVKRAKNHTGYPWTLKLGTDDSYVDFDGWQLMTASLSSAPPDNFGAADDLVLSAVVCGSARKALDPVEMADVDANLRLGPIVTAPRSAEDDPGQEASSHVHAWSEWTDEQPATCTAGGIHSRVCVEPGCADPPAVEREETDALGHDWGSWTVDVAPQVGVAGRKSRDCRRCGEHVELSVAPLVESGPDDYGEPDINAVAYTWTGGDYGLWSAVANWEPSALPAYGIPSNAAVTAEFPPSLGDASVDLGGGSYAINLLHFQQTGRLRFLNGTVKASGNASWIKSGGQVVADGPGTVVQFGNFDYGGSGSTLAAENGGTLKIAGGLRVGYYAPCDHNTFRAAGAGSTLTIGGTWGVNRLGAPYSTFEALDGGQITYTANRTFESSEEYPREKGTRIVASNGTFSVENAAQFFGFGTYDTDAKSYDTRIEVSGTNGLVRVKGKMRLGSSAPLASPLVVAVTYPPEGFANSAPITATKAVTVGSNVLIRVDAAALAARGGAVTNLLVYAEGGLDIDDAALAHAAVVPPAGRVVALRRSADGKALALVVSDSAGPDGPGGDDGGDGDVPAAKISAFTVDGGRVTLRLGNVRNGLWYGVKSATTLEALDAAPVDWRGQAASDSDLTIECVRDEAAGAGFYRVVVDDLR